MGPPLRPSRQLTPARRRYKTNVRKNGQAVTLHYESWPDVDIVPVSKTVNEDGSVNHYNVPDMNSGKWLESRPRRHANAIDAKADECGYQFKPIIRMIKEWNKSHSDLMSSYHIEVLCLRIFDAPLSEYPWEIFQFFDKAATLVQSTLQYEGGRADDYLEDDDDRDEVLNRLETARDRARNAWYMTYQRPRRSRDCDRNLATDLRRKISCVWLTWVCTARLID
jgi:hypothetical protein